MRAAVLFAASLAHATPAIALEVGEPAPPLPDAATAPTGGRVAVINFWATWCGPCIAELPRLEALQRTLGDRAQVVTVNVDTSQRRVDAVAAKLGLTLPILRDTEGRIASAYAPPTMPTTFVVGSDGRVVSLHTGALEDADITRLAQQVQALGGPARAAP